MSDLFYILTLALILFFIMFTLGLANVYHGVRDTLMNAQIGNVYNFEYLQPVTGTYERFLGKVLKVHKLTNQEIQRLNYISNYRVFDENFHRGNTLVTCEMSNGNIRNFYAERTRNCRRTFVGKHMFSLGVAHLF